MCCPNYLLSEGKFWLTDLGLTGTDWDYLIKIFRIALGIARGQFLALHWYLIVLITILEI